MIMISNYIKEQLTATSQSFHTCTQYIELIETAICQNRKRYATSDNRYCYYEQHHILPRSLFPDYESDRNNLVLLTAKEHFIAHKLLTEIWPGQEMAYAFWRMCCCNGTKCEITPEEYEYGRILNSKFPPFKGHTFSAESRQRIGQKSKEFWENGGYVHTKEQDLKMVETRRKNGSYIRSDEMNTKLSEKTKGGIYVNDGKTNKYIRPDELDTYLLQGWIRGKKPLSEEHKRKIGESGKGRSGWNKGLEGTFKGKKHTEESKQKMRDAKRRNRHET